MSIFDLDISLNFVNLLFLGLHQKIYTSFGNRFYIFFYFSYNSKVFYESFNQMNKKRATDKVLDQDLVSTFLEIKQRLYGQLEFLKT